MAGSGWQVAKPGFPGCSLTAVIGKDDFPPRFLSGSEGLGGGVRGWEAAADVGRKRSCSDNF